jgi:hypothetical protein
MPGYCWFPLTGLHAPHHPACSPPTPLPFLLAPPFGGV